MAIAAYTRQALLTLIALFFGVLNCYAQLTPADSGKKRQILPAPSSSQNPANTGEFNRQKLRELALQYARQDSLDRQRAVGKARQNDWPLSLPLNDGIQAPLVGLTQNGLPRYRFPLGSKILTTSSVYSVQPGGTTGFDLDGQGRVVGVWDQGHAQTDHPELSGKISVKDGAGQSQHSTGVAGVIAAEGIDPNAKGVAPKAQIHAYDWFNDASELASAASSSNPLLISNHSYDDLVGWWKYGGFPDCAWLWFGDTTISQVEDYRFGFYGPGARQRDEIAYNAPYLVIFQAAGNSHKNNAGNSSLQPNSHPSCHYILTSSGWDTTHRQTRYLNDGFDVINPHGSAKNTLTIGGCKHISGGYSQPSDVQASSVASWGPVDDGRVKPEVVTVSDGVRKPVPTNNYNNTSGTSFSSPGVAGIAALFQEKYMERNNNQAMRAATVRGLIMHSAYEAGPNPGPDYKFGWGLANADSGARIIDNSKGQHRIIETVLQDEDSLVMEIPAVGGGIPLKASICWTDPPHEVPAPAVDATTPMLVNDLDLRLKRNGITYFPWSLDPLNPTAAADSTQGNKVDNYERVLVPNPTAGDTFRLVINHKDSLSPGQQRVSIILSGVGAPPQISFLESTRQTTESPKAGPESGDCRSYRTLEIPLSISHKPTGDAEVDFTFSGEWDAYDYEVASPQPLIFPSDTDTAQTLQLKIYDDAEVEGPEDLSIAFQVNGSTNAEPGFLDSLQVTLQDNDMEPNGKGNELVFSENFEGGPSLPSGWSTNSAPNEWVVGTSAGLQATHAAYITQDPSTKPLNYNSNNSSTATLVSPPIDASGYDSLLVAFTYKANGENNFDFGELLYTLDGVGFTNIAGTSSGPFVGNGSNALRDTFALPKATANSIFQLAWRWNNDGAAGSAPPFAIDSIALFNASDLQVQHNVTQSTQYFGPNQTIYVYDSTSGNIMARLDNAENHDYGCTEVQVDRTGTGYEWFWYGNNPRWTTWKSLLVRPNNNKSDGKYNITLYYTEEEIATWEAQAEVSRSELNVLKTGGPVKEVDPSNPFVHGMSTNKVGQNNDLSNFGNEQWAISADFSSGFSGFVIGAIDNPPTPSTLPVELARFQGQLVKGFSRLQWQTATEQNLARFIVEKSHDGESFEAIGQVAATGTSSQPQPYLFAEQKPLQTTAYYRLRMIDQDGSFSYSKVISLSPATDEALRLLELFPNPTAEVLHLRLKNQSEANQGRLRITAPSGQVVLNQSFSLSEGIQVLDINTRPLAQGTYFLHLQTASGNLRTSFVKKP